MKQAVTDNLFLRGRSTSDEVLNGQMLVDIS